ncbi:MAG: GAF domain-containing protein [Nitrospirae bacterium]|nr:GAF domain-containing protein [Nitrospirota bacterium]
MKEKDPIEELKRANRELMSLYDVNRLLQTQLSTEEKLYIILTSLTSGDGFGYSRAYIFLTNEQKGTLEGWLGVGPLTGDEAREIWEGVADIEYCQDECELDRKNIADLLEHAPFDIKVRDFIQPIKRGAGHPVQTVISRSPKLVKDAFSGRDPLHPAFLPLLSSPQVAFIPMLSKSRVMGVMAVESFGGERGLDEERLRTLTIFGNLAAIALENAKLYSTLAEKVDSLERLNRELQDAHAKIMHMDRLSSIGAVTAGLAHEIKNPLNSILINLDVLRHEVPGPSAEVDRIIDVLESESVRLNDIVADLLNFAKTPRLSLVTAHPHAVLDQALRLVEYQGENMGIAISKDYNEGVTELMIDEKMMKQAFLNVIINAMQAMPSGGKLTVRTGFVPRGDGRPPDGQFFVEFMDTGHGIPDDCKGRLFDPFFTTKEDGTGMGLPIVDSILRSHGGRVEVESSSGKGTKVTLHVPARM